MLQVPRHRISIPPRAATIFNRRAIRQEGSSGSRVQSTNPVSRKPNTQHHEHRTYSAPPLPLVPHRVDHHHLHSPPLLPKRFVPLSRGSSGHLLLLPQQVHFRLRRARALLLGLQAHAGRLGPAPRPARWASTGRLRHRRGGAAATTRAPRAEPTGNGAGGGESVPERLQGGAGRGV